METDPYPIFFLPAPEAQEDVQLAQLCGDSLAEARLPSASRLNPNLL